MIRVNAQTADRAATLSLLDDRLRWLSAWTIHNANHLRESRDGLKVGGHQASCASMSTIMAALYFYALRPQDRVAVKPYAGPLSHAAHCLAANQSLDQLKRFRGFGGMQSYPSRTKDRIPVDFSTGSVGLSVTVTAFASLVQDYLIAHGQLAETDAGRMIALMGDAELDEGNIYECLIEAYKHDVRNCWWNVDYNRQSLDATTANRMFRRFDDVFETCGWRIVTLKHGKRQLAAFAKPGGAILRNWIETASNADYAALTYQGGATWRTRLLAEIGGEPGNAAGQHIELGIAEHNLFLMLAALGLAGPLFGTRLLPLGTVYDPFIARGLDALNYACYQDARFLLVATPSGLTLGPEGGAHQSVGTPLIGMSPPGLTAFEPAFFDELAAMLEWAFVHLQAEDGGSAYLRPTTRSIAQVTRTDDRWREGALEGGYWPKPPAVGAEAAIVYCGAVAPEAIAAWEEMHDDLPGLGLLAFTSSDLLHAGWTAQRAAHWTGARGAASLVAGLLAALSPTAGLVTVIDGHPATLSWLGAVRGQCVSPLGVERFGQTGDLPDLYGAYRLDIAAITDPMAELFL